VPGRWNLLVVVEVLALLAWVGLAARTLIDSDGAEALVPLESSSLATGPGQERWTGIFFQDQHVGFAVSRVSPTADGGQLFEQRSSFRFATFGKLQEIVTASAALTTAEGALQRFDFFMASDQIRLAARGEVKGDEIQMEVEQAGETSTLSFPIEDPPHVGSSLEAAIRPIELVEGLRFSVPYFDPVSMSQGKMNMRVVGTEVLDNGDEAFWLEREFNEVQTRVLVTPEGETLREEGGPLGLSIVRMSAADARNVPTSDEPVDLIALSAVALKGVIPAPRKTRFITLRVRGISADRFPHEPPLQRVEGDEVTVDAAMVEALPELPVRDTEADPGYLEATLTLPTAHPDIRDKARELVGDAPDRATAARLLNDYVYDYVEKVPSMGVPNGLEVLQTAQGDCNEHTALYVSLARAAGIPSRIAAGVVYSDRVTERGAFYYHAWPEVKLGGPTEWVPVDPTFGQFPADATHVKLVEGDLDRQIEIMGVMGRLAFEVIEVR